MNNTNATPRADSLAALARVLRGFAEGSLVVLGFAVAILLIGTPLALLFRTVHDGMSWLVASGGETSVLRDAFVSVSGVVGGVVLLAVFVRLLAGFFNWRRRFLAGLSEGRASHRIRASTAATTRSHRGRRNRNVLEAATFT